MEFFTAGDVLEQATTGTPDEPETISVEASIQTALEKMFEYDFDQLPVEDDGRIVGVISYRSVSQVIKSFDEIDVSVQNAGFALEDPEFVDRERDVYDLFKTLAIDDYVLVGGREDLEAIITRYDVFYFLEEKVRPFLLIGDIESALRQLFAESFDELGIVIEETFAERANHDESYDPPEQLDDFGFWEYQRFIAEQWDSLGEYFNADRNAVVDMINEVGSIRNALFHFRAAADSVDRDLLKISREQVLEARRQATS